MTVVGLCLLSCVGKPDRVKTTEGVVQEPEEFLRSVHLLHGGIAARPTGTDKSRRTRTENECYEILKEAKTKNWTPMPETKAFMPVFAGEPERQIGADGGLPASGRGAAARA